MKKLFNIKLGLFLSLFCTSLYATPTLPDESKVQVTFFVSPGGNDNNPGTQNSPLQTIGKAWNLAMNNLKASRGVKISLADGTYDQGGGQLKIGDITQRSAAQDKDFNNAYDINVAGISDNNLKNTVFVIEGQNAGKAIITGSADQVIWINGKYNFVMRNITMKGCTKTAIYAGSWEPMSDTRYWLLENCNFVENGNGHKDFIVYLQTIRDISMINCHFNDNYGNGAFLTLIDAQLDNCEFNNNLRSLGEPSFGTLDAYAGGINFSGLNVIFNSCKFNDNGGVGFHNDLAGKNITFTGCEFNNNGHSIHRDGLDPGFKWEIAEGPVYINNCKINDNATGVQLETAQNFYFDKCQIQNNTITQVKITWKNRTVIDNNNSDKYGNGGTGDLSVAPGKIWIYRKALNGTLNSNFTNNCISTTKGSSSNIYLRRDDTSWDLYTNWLTNEFHGNNNTYYSSTNTNVFNTNQVFTDLAGWKSATGKDAASTWDNLCSLLPPPGTGSGLRGNYYNTNDLSGNIVLTEIDTSINNNWGVGNSPSPLIHPTDFSIRWMGKIQSRYSQRYTFYTISEGGIRLWVNGKLLINNWIDHISTENSDTISLTAGSMNSIKVEYSQKNGSPSVKLEWSGKNQTRQVVPKLQLYPATEITLTALPRSGWTASAFASSGTDTPDKAIDGDTITKWSSGNNLNSGQWFIVNMISPQTFNKIDFDAGAENITDYAREYNIYVSNDGSTWGNPIASGTGTGRYIAATFLSKTAQYIKIEQTGQSKLYWWAINEFNVYNTGTILGLSDPVMSPEQISLYPNPTNEGLNLDFFSSKNGSGIIDLKALDAKTEKTIKINVQQGLNKVYFRIDEIKEGIHLLYLNVMGNTRVYKVIIAK